VCERRTGQNVIPSSIKAGRGKLSDWTRNTRNSEMDGRSLGKVRFSCDLVKTTLLTSELVGTYTFPISFEIPSDMPPSLECDGGSVTWRLVAKVRRPGVFTSKLTATRVVKVVSIPSEADIDPVSIERPWEDQLHYLFQTSGKAFAIGAALHIKMTLMPLAKVQVYKLAVDLEGQ
jgi:Arrestin (or S-antigen), N-terminal domain